MDSNDHLEAAFVAQLGAFLLTAHLGNWGFGGRILAQHGGQTTHVVLSTEEDPDIERYLRVGTPQLRFVTRRHSTSTIGLLAALRRDALVAMQGDRPTGGRGDLPVPFFVAPAWFPLAPFLLARASRAPVVQARCEMGHTGRYQNTKEPPIWVQRWRGGGRTRDDGHGVGADHSRFPHPVVQILRPARCPSCGVLNGLPSRRRA